MNERREGGNEKNFIRRYNDCNKNKGLRKDQKNIFFFYSFLAHIKHGNGYREGSHFCDDGLTSSYYAEFVS